MAQLTIIANITAKAEQVDLVQTELEKLIPLTRAEQGCLQYDLHRDNSNPAHFLFFEKWESRELWQVHMNTEHLQGFIAATDGALEDLTVNEMTLIC